MQLFPQTSSMSGSRTDAVWSVRWLVWPFLLIYGAFALAGFQVASAQSYQVEGTVILDSIRSKFKEADVDFRLSVQGSNWFIRTTTTNKNLGDYQEASFDGTNLYYICSMETAVRELIRKEGKRVGENVANGQISRDRFLHHSFAHCIAPVCFAYASGPYLDGVSEGVAEPIVYDCLSTGSYSHYNPIKQRIEVTRHVTAPRLPKYAVYYDDGFRRDRFERDKAVRRRPPYDQGFTNAIYVAESFTNVSGYSLPAKATLYALAPLDNEQFTTPHPGERASDLLVRRKYTITLRSARVGGSALRSFRPRIPGRTYVEDTRFLHQVPDSTTYFITRRWLTDSEVTNSRPFKASLRPPQLPPIALGLPGRELVLRARITLVCLYSVSVLVLLCSGIRNARAVNPVAGKTAKHALGIALLTLLGMAVWPALGLLETSYAGKSLNHWLQLLAQRNFETQPEAIHAIRQIGPAALPSLIRLLETQDSPLKQKIEDWTERLNLFELSFEPASMRHRRAIQAFEILDEETGKPAFPALLTLLNDGKTSQQAAEALWAIGPSGLFSLTNVVPNPDSRVRLAVLRILARAPGNSWPKQKPTDPEALAKAFVPVCLAYLQDTNRNVRTEAAQILGWFRSEPTLVIPSLALLLEDSQYSPRWAACEALAGFGEPATNALPALSRYAERANDRDEREMARRARHKIELRAKR